MTRALAYWVDTLDPFLIHIHGNFGIRYYGLGYAAGFLIAAWLLGRYAAAGRSLLPQGLVGDYMVAAVLGVAVGGRVGSYFLYDAWRTFGTDPLGIFKVWDGGMSFHGGLAGTILAVGWFAHRRKIPVLHLWDLTAAAAPPGIFLVRIANFINGELWGKVSAVSWAVIFPRSAEAGTPVAAIAPRHPSQLYEAGMEGLLLGLYMQLRMWRTPAIREHPGRLAGEFLIFYAVVRMIGEHFREPDAGISLLFGLSRGTFYSLFMVAFGLYLRQRRVEPLNLPRVGPAAR